MANDYTDIDLRLRKSSSMYIFNDLTKDSLEAQEVKFQFPPIIKSDSKKANWQDFDIASYEPYSLWTGSDARRLEVQLEYIVTSKGKADWNVENIITVMRKLKSYFYITIERGQATYPLVKAAFYEYSPAVGAGSDRLGTWRLHEINIQPSGALVEDGNKVCHLKHTISFSMSLITQQLSLSSEGSDENKGKVDTEALKLDPRKDRSGSISPWF